MERTVQKTSAVVALAAALWFFGVWFLEKPNAQSPVPGRFDVVSTNSELFPVVLFDTATGSTWTACVSPAGEKEWCSVSRTDSPAR